MGLFVKCCGGALLSAILVATVENRNKVAWDMLYPLLMVELKFALFK